MSLEGDEECLNITVVEMEWMESIWEEDECLSPHGEERETTPIPLAEVKDLKTYVSGEGPRPPWLELA